MVVYTVYIDCFGSPVDGESRNDIPILNTIHSIPAEAGIQEMIDVNELPVKE